jgi:hypothetical protein
VCPEEHGPQYCTQDGYSKFKPHYMLRKCSYDADAPECTTNCIHRGRYCAVDSISDTFTGKFKGWQVCAGSSHVPPCYLAAAVGPVSVWPVC